MLLRSIDIKYYGANLFVLEIVNLSVDKIFTSLDFDSVIAVIALDYITQNNMQNVLMMFHLPKLFVAMP